MVAITTTTTSAIDRIAARRRVADGVFTAVVIEDPRLVVSGRCVDDYDDFFNS